MEIWKEIKGFEDYQISHLGNVKSLTRRIVGGWKTRMVNERKLKILHGRAGYDYVYLGKNNKKNIHNLIAEAFIPNPENKPCINHKNGIKTDNRISNLEWVSYAENSQHAVKTGLQKSHENHCNAKLKNKEVLEIRAKYIPFVYGCPKLAQEYNVSKSTIQDIISNRYWNGDLTV